MSEQKIATLFPGQGSQVVGMGLDLFETIPESRIVFETANDVLGFSLTDFCFGNGAADADRAHTKLTHTAICQPALYTHSIAILAALKLSPDLVAGHSVGEYSALHACGALSFEDGLRLVRRRGELMAMAGQGRPAGMTAVIGLSAEAVESICETVSIRESIVVCANYNAPEQVVISGDKEALQLAERALKNAGARSLIQLPVSGAFHSPLVSAAREALAQELASVTLKPPVCPIYLNVTAQPARDPEHIRARMLEQLTSPVRWFQSLQNMPEDMHFMEVGPGRVLTGLVRRTLGRKVKVTFIGTAKAVDTFMAE